MSRPDWTMRFAAALLVLSGACDALAGQTPDSSHAADTLTICHLVMMRKQGDTVSLGEVCAPARWWRLRLLSPVPSAPPRLPKHTAEAKKESG